jgi:hypothetical protein
MAPMESDDTWSAVQSLLAIDLNKMSLNEREKVFEDLHGVSDLVDESPELVAACLDELELGIAKIRRRDAYVAAASKDSSYTSSRTLRLKFLRAEHFDSNRAAARLVGFFEAKLEAFGPDPLARDLLLSDLDKDDRTCLQSGLMTLAVKDVAGRGIMTWMPMLKEEGVTARSKVRVTSVHCGGSIRFTIRELNGVLVLSLYRFTHADALLTLFIFCGRRG